MTDADGGSKLQMVTRWTAFAIDAASGVLTVADSNSNRSRNSCILHIGDFSFRWNKRCTESLKITITVTDVNDNSPVFSDGDSITMQICR